MADEDNDILPAFREKHPEYAGIDDTTLALKLGEASPAYRPHLRKYLDQYPVAPPATAASAAQDVEGERHTMAKALTEPSPVLTKAIEDMPATDPRAAIGKGVLSFANKNMTLANAAIGGVVEAGGKAASTAAAMTFGPLALKQMADQAPTAYAKWQAGDHAGALKELTELGLTGLAAVFMGKHAVEGAKATLSPIESERATQTSDLEAKQEAHKNIKDVLGEGHEATETARRAVEQQQEVIDALNAATSEQPWTPEQAERRVTARPPTPENIALNEKYRAQRLAQDEALNKIRPEPTPEEVAAEPDPMQPQAVQGANGEKVIPNQPPSPDAEAGLTTELSMRGVDTNDPQAVMDHLNETDQTAKVRSVGDVPVSASYVGPKGYESDLADASPYKVAHEVVHMAAEEGKLPPPPEGPGANDQVVADTLTRKTGDPVGAFNRMAHTANQQLSDVASQIENTVFQTETVTNQMDRIAEKGTIAPEQRAEFRQGDKPETFNLRVSQADVKHITAQLVEAMRNAKQLAVEVRFQGDPVSRTTAKLLDAQVRQADAKVQEVLKEWRTARYAAGRAVDQFQRHPELLDMLRSMGHTADELRNAQRRAPILSNMLLKDFTKASPAEKWQLAKDAMDYLRYTKFSATSFVMDITTDGWNLGAMLAGDIGGDVARAATGRLDFSNLRGFVRALDDRFMPYKDAKTGKWRLDRINPALREELGHTISGENIPGFGTSGPGAFTYREGFGTGATRSISRKISKAVDYATGGPMYAKGLVDQAAGEIAVSASLWQDAIKQTPPELRGAAAYQWRRNFVENPPEASATAALELGNKAKFNRPLSDLEEKIAGSTPYRLIADIYARWPFQFARALAENLGADPAALRGIVSAAKSGKGLDAAELTGKYLGKSLTGLGGVYFIYQSMKDKFDAKSAEYVKDDGNRIRLSGKQPVPEAMLLGYMIEGAWRTATQGKEAGEPYIAKALAVSQYTSIPFIHGFKGGLLTSFIDAYSDAQKNSSFNPRGTERLIVDQINQAIPGGAVLGVLKSMSDDITREGVGANLPGVSLTLPEQPNSSTGEPLRLRQEMFGVNMPQMRGSPIPGATRILDPVTKLLMKYGQTVYRTNRSPIAGVPANDLSPELQREWEFQLGQARTVVFHALTQGVNLDELPPEAARKLVAKQDALAAQLATKQIQIRYGIKPKPFREPTSRELTGPSELMERYNLAKQAREQALAEEQ